ncbi:MAG TPA: ABC transporter permease [Vicinamibacterales bacterium]|jgi:predicted permease
MESILLDARFAVRSLARSRAFTAAVVLTLAAGIGSATAVFSAFDQVLVRPLPYPDSARLVRIWEEHPGAVRIQAEPPLSNRTLYAWRERMQTLEGIAAYGSREYTVGFDDAPTRVKGAEVSASLFSLLRAVPAAGRFFNSGEDAPSNRRFVVLSDRLWRDRFGARADVVGRPLAIDGTSYQIVGVTPAGFRFPDGDAQLWTPFDDPTLTSPNVQGGIWLVFGLGRLKPGVSISQVEQEGTAVARSIPRAPVANLLFGVGGPVQVRAQTLADQLTGGVRPALFALAAAVLFVLLIACANVATLFLARGVARARELALRAAIGASPGRLTQQLFTETAILSVAAGALGLLLAAAIIRVLPALAPRDFPRLDQLHLDGRVALAAAVLTIATALLCGLAPRLRARVDLAAPLHGAGDGSTAGGFRGARSRRLRDALLVAQSAFAVLLIVGAALVGRSFSRLVHVDGGYDVNVLSARLYMPAGLAPSRAHQKTIEILERLRADPQVVAAGAGNMMPFDSTTWITGFTLPPDVGGGKAPNVRAINYRVTAGYAEALGLRLHEGRFLTSADAGRGRVAALVNDEFVRQHLSSGPVAGRQFRGGVGKDQQTAMTEIVGVVGNVLKDGNDARPQPEVYTLGTDDRPLTDEIDVVVRTLGQPGRAAPALREIAHSVGPDIAVAEVVTIADRLSASVARPRFAATAFGGFAGLALALASIGLFGVLSYAVSQRRRELGVRAALGATRHDLMLLLFREGLTLTAAGIAIGLAASTVLLRPMSVLLFGVTPSDPMAFAAGPLVLLPVALAACLGPALGAAGADPTIALRSE